MNEQELFDLIARGKGPDVEFRSSLKSDFGEDLCAFANGEGGTLVIGVAGSGEIASVGNQSRARARVLTMARSADPPIVVEVEIVGEVLCVTVPPQKHKPYSIGWRSFVREGAANRRLSNAEVKDLHYAVGRAHFDREPCESFSLDRHLQAEVWEEFVRRAKIPEAMQTIPALRNLGLVDAEDRVTRAAAWLLAHDIRRFTESAYVSCALFEGTDEAGGREQRDFHSALPTMIDEVMAWVLRRINAQLAIRGERGKDRPELPGQALFEAVANAVAHRDYRSPEPVRVHVFRDRVEVTSPGGLPEGMSESDLGTRSLPRNPTLYSALARMHLVGKSGSGIRRMNSLCREHGVEEPLIEVLTDRVTANFKRSPTIQVEPSTIQDDELLAAQEGLLGIRKAVRGREEPDAGFDDTGSPRLSYMNNTNIIQDIERKTTAQVRELVRILDRDRSRVEILEALGLRNRSNLVVNYLRPALDAGLVEMTIPDKPTSRRQKYRLTRRGREVRAILARGRPPVGAFLPPG